MNDALLPIIVNIVIVWNSVKNVQDQILDGSLDVSTGAHDISLIFIIFCMI